MSAKLFVIVTVAVAVLASCNRVESMQPEADRTAAANPQGISINRLLSGEMFRNQGPDLNVNEFLWAATLDTLDFLPLASTDPFGGVITTDWGSPAGVSAERFRATAFIGSDQLAVNSLRLALYRQVLTGGAWVDAAVSDATVRQIEDAILLRARQLRRADAISG